MGNVMYKISLEQQYSLEAFFQENSFPTGLEMEQLSETLIMPLDALYEWFENRREKEVMQPCKVRATLLKRIEKEEPFLNMGQLQILEREFDGFKLRGVRYYESLAEKAGVSPKQVMQWYLRKMKFEGYVPPAPYGGIRTLMWWDETVVNTPHTDLEVVMLGKNLNKRMSSSSRQMLRAAFYINPSPSEAAYEEMAMQTGISESDIQMWFRYKQLQADHRMRRRELEDEKANDGKSGVYVFTRRD